MAHRDTPWHEHMKVNFLNHARTDNPKQVLVLHPQWAAARTPQEKTVLERQLAATDTQIDRLVYDLYGLTADEINIVEGRAG